jgi:16S rRNA (uracil1498-N3)-methyltransferase
LGVADLAPLHTRRGVAQPVEHALERLRRGVIEASKQCGRNRLMTISEPQAWSEFVAASPGAAGRFVAHPAGDPVPIVRRSPGEAMIVAVGPEGGLTEEEMAVAFTAGWRPVGLGPRILRVETAALAMAAWAIGFG